MPFMGLLTLPLTAQQVEQSTGRQRTNSRMEISNLAMLIEPEIEIC